jgi:hypothetical protein
MRLGHDLVQHRRGRFLHLQHDQEGYTGLLERQDLGRLVVVVEPAERRDTLDAGEDVSLLSLEKGLSSRRPTRRP